MSNGTFFVILSSLLLLQGYSGKPHSINEPTSSEAESEESQELHPKVADFMISLFGHLTTHIDYTINETEQFFKDVLADANATGDKTNEEITNRTELISDIVDKLEKLRKNTSAIERWEVGVIILDTIDNITTSENPSDEDRVFRDYFKKHGFEAIGKKLETKLKGVFTKIEGLFEEFWNGLNIEEQDEYKHFNDWHHKLVEENDTDKKLEFLADILG